MTHKIFTEKISLWLDNELSPDEVNELQTHLAECPACYQLYQALNKVDGFLHNASKVMVEPSPGFSARFEARLARQNAKRGQMWLGLTVLFLGTLALAIIGTIIAGSMFVGLNVNLVYTQTITMLCYGLGEVGGIVNEIRAFVNLGGLFFKAALMTMSEPLFWGYVIVTLALTATWVRVMQLLYRRAPLTAMLFI